MSASLHAIASAKSGSACGAMYYTICSCLKALATAFSSCKQAMEKSYSILSRKRISSKQTNSSSPKIATQQPPLDTEERDALLIPETPANIAV
ncbi:hypothetical protein DM860_001364 [Cuscuta australis]|uniref:Uncharacterized protein n=1 Tax=Cuscuta australis TaxID=267555 RepID=A0A328DTN6_9ASTE|nr:hypothetical protein DM860_001364 [Cuscuta australis]